MQIDAHQHYWHPARGDYNWMPAGHPVLDRPYGPADLAPSLARHGIARTILVQAAPTVAETHYMLGVADATPSVAGVVGWIDFEDRAQSSVLERLAAHPKFLGVRPMIQDIADVDWMLRDDVAWAYPALTDLGLAFDALGFPRHLDNFARIRDRNPALRMVIDHCMKPQIRDHSDASLADWSAGMARLAGAGLFVKLSGLVTEAAAGWTADDLRPYAHEVLRLFGPERVMWGSDWPVCLNAGSYDHWRSAAEALTAHLDAGARAAVFGGTAARFYGVDAA
ncbi:amidohydrolase family protein [Rhodobacteraceae bacterium 2CG4]|uniref:Amidohydrolase family protein n=1 Tax=Halovulum marinum TaxID=2662447 RepID=A0A6L5Z0K6_9RHOB|nr:amidohydrolase family protein [Halovulum marinum]MSU90071.1 amidohydrolase family protein [Halovulum marinum]